MTETEVRVFLIEAVERGIVTDAQARELAELYADRGWVVVGAFAHPGRMSDDDVFVIPPIVRRYRYLLAGGHTLDVDSPYRADSADRGLVLDEAKRRWGGKKDDWKIEGVALLADPDEPDPS